MPCDIPIQTIRPDSYRMAHLSKSCDGFYHSDKTQSSGSESFRSAHLCLLNAGIKGLHYYCPAWFKILYSQNTTQLRNTRLQWLPNAHVTKYQVLLLEHPQVWFEKATATNPLLSCLMITHRCMHDCLGVIVVGYLYTM